MDHMFSQIILLNCSHLDVNLPIADFVNDYTESWRLIPLSINAED